MREERVSTDVELQILVLGAAHVRICCPCGHQNTLRAETFQDMAWSKRTLAGLESVRIIQGHLKCAQCARRGPNLEVFFYPSEVVPGLHSESGSDASCVICDLPFTREKDRPSKCLRCSLLLD